MRFKQFEIRKPTFLGDPPTEDYYKYNFDLVKWDKGWDDKEYCFSIGHLEWNRSELYFAFKSHGLRYLQHRADGLEEWIMVWCKLKKIEYEHERDNE